MTANGIPAFITHTKADVKQTQAAIEGGARHATHFYDVFYAPDETDGGVRPCGAVEAILADGRVSVDFILDGGETPGRLGSTIVGFKENRIYCLRPGPIAWEKVQEIGERTKKAEVS